jgi:hypothetical protein
MENLQITKRAKTCMLKIAGQALEFLPMSGAPADSGTGRKISFPIPLKQEPKCAEDFLYVFAESKLPYIPKEIEIGYTEDDIEDAVGIYIFRKSGDRSYGKVYPLDELFREVFTDLSLQNRVIFKLNEMKKIAHIDNDFLEAANNDRANRKVGDLAQPMRLH